MNLFFVIILLITVFCVYSGKVENFSCCSSYKSCKCNSCSSRSSCCKPKYFCKINKHLRRKCTWLSPCYN